MILATQSKRQWVTKQEVIDLCVSQDNEFKIINKLKESNIKRYDKH